MHLEVLTPEKKLFTGEISSIILPGVAGSFQLLENHAPIIAALEKGTIEIKGESSKSISISDGFVECLKNKVVVLIGSGAVS